MTGAPTEPELSRRRLLPRMLWLVVTLINGTIASNSEVNARSARFHGVDIHSLGSKLFGTRCRWSIGKYVVAMG